MNDEHFSITHYRNKMFFFDIEAKIYVPWVKAVHQLEDPWQYIFLNPFQAYITVYLEIASAFFG